MAIKINLLPPEERQSSWPANQIMVLSAIVTVAVVMIFAGFHRYTIWQLEKEVMAAQQQYSLLNLTQNKMLLASSKNQLVTAKTTLLVNLTTGRKPWHAAISRLGVITPPQIWLTELAGADNDILRIKGNALTYPDLVTFLQQLEQDELLTEPQLSKAEQDASAAITKFELNVKVKKMP
jgi:type IV pilus assembly protein PilN